MLKEQPVLATILRAGLPLHQGLLNYFDRADNAFISAYRKHHRDGTFEISLDYVSCPNLENRVVIVADPMLATGNSAVAAIDKVKAMNPKSVKFLCLLTCPEGLRTMQQAHPDVPVFTAAVDRQLNDHGYILPGLGDAGDRIFGTQ